MEHKADKGHPGGSCNREACQRPYAFWFNHSTRKYYCRHCAHDINRANPEGCAWTGGDGSPLLVLDESTAMQHVGNEAVKHLRGEENCFNQMVMSLRRVPMRDGGIEMFILAARNLSQYDLPGAHERMRELLGTYGFAQPDTLPDFATFHA